MFAPAAAPVADFAAAESGSVDSTTKTNVLRIRSEFPETWVWTEAVATGRKYVAAPKCMLTGSSTYFAFAS